MADNENKTWHMKISGMLLKQHLQCNRAVQRCVDTVLPLPPLTDNSSFVQLLESELVLGHILTNRSDENDAIWVLKLFAISDVITVESLRLPCSEEALSSLLSDKRP